MFRGTIAAAHVLHARSKGYSTWVVSVRRRKPSGGESYGVGGTLVAAPAEKEDATPPNFLSFFLKKKSQKKWKERSSFHTKASE